MSFTLISRKLLQRHNLVANYPLCTSHHHAAHTVRTIYAAVSLRGVSEEHVQSNSVGGGPQILSGIRRDRCTMWVPWLDLAGL